MPPHFKTSHPWFPIATEVDPFVAQLPVLLGEELQGNGMILLEGAVLDARKQKIKQMEEIGIVDANSYLLFASGMLKWIPYEAFQGRDVYWVLCLFYYILDQAAISRAQTAITPQNAANLPQSITKVSAWIVEFAQKVGSFMSTTESLTQDSLRSFEESPNYHLYEAEPPVPNGWQTFNELFSRKLKPGMRPVISPDDDTIITYPADCTFDSKYRIGAPPAPDANSVCIPTPGPDVKYINWSIPELLHGSGYEDKFENGQWMHAFLGPTDYHRQHTPIRGRVLHAKVIQALAYLEVITVPDPDGGLDLIPRRRHQDHQTRTVAPKKVTVPGEVNAEVDAPDDPGYEFMQTRGCIIMHNDTVGYVAILPIGMAQVSSVRIEQNILDGLAAHQTVTLEKGAPMSWFEFGGSDIVLVFQQEANVEILEEQQHYNYGQVLGKAWREL